MDEKPKESPETKLSRLIGTQAARKLHAQRNRTKSIWFGLGMSGLIGWTVMVPTLMGAALGVWIDKNHPSPYSWTLMLLLIGLLFGCFTAGHWLDAEYKEMQEDQDD